MSGRRSGPQSRVQGLVHLLQLGISQLIEIQILMPFLPMDTPMHKHHPPFTQPALFFKNTPVSLHTHKLPSLTKFTQNTALLTPPSPHAHISPPHTHTPFMEKQLMKVKTKFLLYNCETSLQLSISAAT